jgi:hypothetical protein
LHINPPSAEWAPHPSAHQSAHHFNHINFLTHQFLESTNNMLATKIFSIITFALAASAVTIPKVRKIRDLEPLGLVERQSPTRMFARVSISMDTI